MAVEAGRDVDEQRPSGAWSATGGARVAVVGAGLAGLAAAEALHRAGAEVLVFEARPRLGGRVSSVEFAGTVVERGAEFITPHDAVVLDVCARLGLPLLVKGTLYGDREPRDVASSRSELLRAADVVGEAAAAGRLRGSARGAADALDLSEATREAVLARLEVSSTGTAEQQGAAVLAEATSSFGTYDTFSVVGGNQRIAEALAAPLGTGIHRSAPVRRISVGDAGVRLRVAGAEVEADVCVLAVPPTVLDAIAFDPPLPEPTASALSRVVLGRAAKLALRLEVPIPPSAVLSVRERYWSWTQLLHDGAWSPAAGCFAGGETALRALEVDEGPGTWVRRLRALRPELVVDEASALLSIWHDDPWVRGSYSVATGDGALADPALTRTAGRLVLAGEHTAGALHGTMNGALASGERAATETTRVLGARPARHT